MKKIMTIILAAAMILSMAACSVEEPAPKEPENGSVTMGEELLDDEAAPLWKVQPVYDCTEPIVPLSAATLEGDELDAPAEVQTLIGFTKGGNTYMGFKKEDAAGSADVYQNKPVSVYRFDFTHIEDSHCDVVMRIYDSPETAAREAGNYVTDDGSDYGYVTEDGFYVCHNVDRAAPAYLWLDRCAIIELCTDDQNVVDKLANIYREPFSGVVDLGIDQNPDTCDEVGETVEYLIEKGLYAEHHQEDVTKYSFEGYEHKPVEYWIFELQNGEKAFLKMYDSPAAATDESKNYLGGDPCSYSYDGGGMCIDYALPVYMWQYSAAIIELGTKDTSLVKDFDDIFGGHFAGVDITDIAVDEPYDEPYVDTAAPVSDKLEATAANTLLDKPDVLKEDVDATPSEAKVPDFAVIDLESGAHASAYPVEPVLLTAFTQFDSFNNEYKDIMSGSENEKKLAKYDKNYFNANSLLVIPMFEGSISEGYEIEKFEYEGSVLKIDTLNHDTGDEAIDPNLMFVELIDMKPSAKEKLEITRNVLSGGQRFVGKKLVYKDLMPADNSVVSAVGFEYTNVRVNGNGYPRQKIFTSREQLEKYRSSLSSDIFNLSDFDKQMERYPESWFETKSIVLVAVEFGSGSTSVFVDKVAKSDSKVEVTIHTETPETFTDDMAGWQIFVEVDKLSGSETVEVKGIKQQTVNTDEVM